MRIECLTSETFSGSGLLLRVDPFAVLVLRTHEDGGRRDRLSVVRSEGIKIPRHAPRAGIALAMVAALGLQGCELAVLGAAGTAAYSIAEDRRTSGTQFDDETIQPWKPDTSASPGEQMAAQERAFWEAKIQQDAATTYETILKSVTEEMNKNPLARRLMIQIAYAMAFGRMPTDGDMNYWQPRSENFRELVEASRNWLYSPNGAADLNAAVTSVLQTTAGKMIFGRLWEEAENGSNTGEHRINGSARRLSRDSRSGPLPVRIGDTEPLTES